MANQHHNPYLTPTIGQKRRRAPRPLIWLPDQLDMFEQRIADTGAIVSDLQDIVAIRTASGGFRFAECVEGAVQS